MNGITLDDSFPEEAREDLRTVADDVHRIVRRRFRAAPPCGDRPIECFRRHPPPQLVDLGNESKYRIALFVSDRHYARLAYQLAHELGHIMFDPRRTNAAIEMLATALSLQVLDDLAARWQLRPPVASWREYAPCFREYREVAEEQRLNQVPARVRSALASRDFDTVAGFLRALRTGQEHAGIHSRAREMLGAIALRSGGIEWPQTKGVAALTTPTPDEDGRYRDDLDLDLKQASEYVRGLLKRIGC
jgi:hypothetical protein